LTSIPFRHNDFWIPFLLSGPRKIDLKPTKKGSRTISDAFHGSSLISWFLCENFGSESNPFYICKSEIEAKTMASILLWNKFIIRNNLTISKVPPESLYLWCVYFELWMFWSVFISLSDDYIKQHKSNHEFTSGAWPFQILLLVLIILPSLHLGGRLHTPVTRIREILVISQIAVTGLMLLNVTRYLEWNLRVWISIVLCSKESDASLAGENKSVFTDCIYCAMFLWIRISVLIHFITNSTVESETNYVVLVDRNFPTSALFLVFLFMSWKKWTESSRTEYLAIQ